MIMRELKHRCVKFRNKYFLDYHTHIDIIFTIAQLPRSIVRFNFLAQAQRAFVSRKRNTTFAPDSSSESVHLSFLCKPPTQPQKPTNN